MSFEKIVSVDLIEVASNGCVQVRTQTSIMENGKKIIGNFHSHIVVPGADYSEEDARVQVICKATQTKDVVAAYKAAQTEKQIG